jgi:hypothetical protein
VPGELHRRFGEGIEMRRLHHRMAEARQAVAAPLVDSDEQDVATAHADS